MTTLRQSPPPTGGQPPETEEERTARMERTLRGAASWQADTDAPQDLCDRLARRLAKPTLLGRLRNSLTLLPGGWGTLSAVGLSAAVAILVLQVRHQGEPYDAALAYLSVIKSSSASSYLPRDEEMTPATKPAGARIQSIAYTQEAPPKESADTTGEPGVAPVRPRIHPRRSRSHPRHLAQSRPVSTPPVAEKPRAPVWHYEETPPEDYAVQVPVVLTQTGPNGEVTTVPAMMEMNLGKSSALANNEQ